MVTARPTIVQIRQWLGDVPDPEIPVLSVVDLGIVRAVAWTRAGDEEVLEVTITPTYSGCPATRVIEREIVRVLRRRGIERVKLDVQIAPPWTTDWISEAGRQKLRGYGIAPPGPTSAVLAIRSIAEPPVACPRCASFATTMTSRFGSTPCKALYRCDVCREPFDHFKCH